MNGKYKNKLSQTDIANIQALYANGRTLAEIKTLLLLDVDRKTIYYWVHKADVPYIHRNFKHLPDIGGAIFIHPTEKTYRDIWETEEERKIRAQNDCEHGSWIRKCSHCGKILESEHTHEDHPCVEILI